MTDDPAAASPPPNLTRANITGKVPITEKRIRRGKRKSAKLSADKKSHVNSLMKRGLISSKSASSNGLKK